MGTLFSSDKIEPEELPSEEFVGPTKARKLTDVTGIILLVIYSLILFGLMGYCAYHSDIYRIIYGYDSCGNVCGRVTPPETNPDFPCKGGNFTNKKYLLIKAKTGFTFSNENSKKECVEDCSAYPLFESFLHRCIHKDVIDPNEVTKKIELNNFFHEMSEDLRQTTYHIIGLCFLSLILTILMVLLMKLYSGFLIWFVLGGTLSLLLLASISCWFIWAKLNDKVDKNQSERNLSAALIVFTAMLTSVTAILFVVLFVLRKRIQLVIELLKEAGKAITMMPLLFVQPLYTIAALAVIITLWLYFLSIIESAGILTLGAEQYYYDSDITMMLTRWYNLFGLFWMIQFCIGCQQMIIAGAVAEWFFTRDKTKLRSPIMKSAYNLTRFHLGSVAIGSLIIAIFQLMRTLMKTAEYCSKSHGRAAFRLICRIIYWCLSCFESILMFISRNAYIEIAIYGQPFYTSGKHAFKVLVNNALRVATINTVGDFVLGLSKVFVAMATVIAGYVLISAIEGIHHVWVPLVLVGAFAFFVAHCFFTVYEMCIDTIFICFCEDCEMNDGINKPYFMSRNLMELVKNSNNILGIRDSPNQTPLKTIN